MKRLQKIDEYQFPAYMRADTVAEIALKQFFKAWVASGYKPLAMPSKTADLLWHTLILDTKEYAKFCKEILGKFMHHTTNAARSGDNRAEVQRTWHWCCFVEGRDAYDMHSPLCALFAADSVAGEGFIWVGRAVDKRPGYHSVEEMLRENI